VSHSERPVDAPRGEGRVLVRDDVAIGAPHYDHAQVRDLLSDYLDGSLPAAERERVRLHLDDCDACRAFGNTLGKLIDVTRQLPPPRLREEAKQRILEQLHESSTPT
jgi:anti-sigma factor RsiW